jgi:uncharacterized protein (DUF1800 family)
MDELENLTSMATIIHVLNRLTFGISPGDIDRVKSQGIKAYIESQLNPNAQKEASELTDRLERLSTLKLNNVELYQKYGPQTKEERQSSQRSKTLQTRRQIRTQTINARIFRGILSNRQLQEVMVDFWFSHFNVHMRKGFVYVWVSNYEREAIAPNALGNFRRLLEATARHPAMLYYLDNWQNTDPKSKRAKGRFKGLNENYARELMELHTLGVDGGYTQQDVIALARILTGWGIDTQGNRSKGDGFYFDRDRHDFSDKTFLGKTIKGQGEAEVGQVLDILATHPATARHISYKLAQYFVADRPPETLVETLKQKFLSSNGDIKTVLSTLFNSSEFLNPQNYGNKFKTPWQYIISTIRTSGDRNPQPGFLGGILNQMGMPVYGCPTPDGYKNTQEAWLNPDGMMRRLSWATSIANGSLKGDRPLDAKVLAKTLGNNFSAKTQTAIDTTPADLQAALILGSPEMLGH